MGSDDERTWLSARLDRVQSGQLLLTLRDQRGDVARIDWQDPAWVRATILDWVDARVDWRTMPPAQPISLWVERSEDGAEALATLRALLPELLATRAITVEYEDVLGQSPEVASLRETLSDRYPRIPAQQPDDVMFFARRRRWGYSERFFSPTIDPPVAELRSPPVEPSRAVDIALRTGAAPRRRRQPAVVRPTTTLAARKRYEVCVQIGAALRGTLFRVPPPAIDPVLPPLFDLIHPLEVTLFPLDFTLLSSSVQPLPLPRTGPSEAVTFVVRAPARLGAARFRVVVSLRDHMLQSFVVTTEVAKLARASRKRVLNAAIECATTERFANLGALSARDATAIVNDDSAGGHSITIKRGEVAGRFTFTDDQIRKASAGVREVLEEAAASGRFDEPPPRPGTQAHVARKDAYHAMMRTLAVRGASLKAALFSTGDEPGRALLRELKTPEPQRLQLVHVSRSLVSMRRPRALEIEITGTLVDSAGLLAIAPTAITDQARFRIKPGLPVPPPASAAHRRSRGTSRRTSPQRLCLR